MKGFDIKMNPRRQHKLGQPHFHLEHNTTSKNEKKRGRLKIEIVETWKDGQVFISETRGINEQHKWQMFFTKDELTTPRCSFIRTILRISRKKRNVVNAMKEKASSTRQLASESVTIMWKIRLFRPIKDTCPWNLKVTTNKKWQPCAFSNTMPKGKSSLIHNHSTLPFRNLPLLFIIIRCLQEAEANKLSYQQKAPHGVEFKESQDGSKILRGTVCDSLGNSNFWSWCALFWILFISIISHLV